MKKQGAIIYSLAVLLIVEPAISKADGGDPKYTSNPPPSTLTVVANDAVLPPTHGPVSVSFAVGRVDKYSSITVTPLVLNVAAGASLDSSLNNFNTGAENAPLSFAITRTTAYGQLSLGNGGTIHYTPNPGVDNVYDFADITAQGKVGGVVVGVVKFLVGTPPPQIPLPTATLVGPCGSPLLGGIDLSPDLIMGVDQPLVGGLLTLTDGTNLLRYIPPTGFFGHTSSVYYTANGIGIIDITIGTPQISSENYSITGPNGVHLTGSLTNTYGNASVAFDPQAQGLPDGSYSIQLTVMDAAGQLVTAQSQLVVDNTPPICSWIDPLSDALVQGGIRGTVTASDNLSGVRSASFVDPIDSHLSPFVPISQTFNWLYSTYDTREKEGPTQLQAVVYDIAGNVNTCSQPVVSDNIPPAGSIAFNPAALSYNGLMLIRSVNTVTAAGTDGALGTGVASTVLSLDSAALSSINSDSASSVVNTGGYPDGVHSFSGLFTDRVGHSASVVSQVTIDNSAPMVTITAPANGAVVSATLNSVSASIIEANGITAKKILIDDIDTAYTEKNGVFTLTTPITTNGLHTVTVTAKDTVGNTGVDQHAFVIVNGTAGSGGGGGSTTITVVGLGNGSVVGGSGFTNISVVVTGGDGSRGNGITMGVDGGDGVPMLSGPGGTYTYSLDTSGLSTGSHTLTFSTTNSDGQVATTSITVIVDKNPPTLTLQNFPTDGEILSGDAIRNLQASSTDTGGSNLKNMTIYVDGGNMATTLGTGDAASVSYDLNPSSLSVGDHTIEVRATDGAGNVSSTLRHVTIQGGPGGNLSSLTISVVYPTDGLSLSGAFYATVIVTGGPDSVGVRIDGAPTIALTSMGNDRYQVLINTTQFLEGFHVLQFVAANSDGSVSQTVSAYFDLTPPTVDISSPTDGSTLALVRTLKILASDAPGRALRDVRFVLNGTAILADIPGNSDINDKAYSYQWDTSKVNDGDYTLTVIGTDLSGQSTQKTISFHVNNKNPPVSTASVEFRYSNAIAADQVGSFIVGPITSVSAIISNGAWDLTAVNDSWFKVSIIKDGLDTTLTGHVSITGNRIIFDGAIPANVRVSLAVRGLDSIDSIVGQTASIISAMPASVGGSVSVNPSVGLKLTIPSGALSEDALVEMTPTPADSPELQGAQSLDSQFSQDKVVYGPFTISALGRNGFLDSLQAAAALAFQPPAQEQPLNTAFIERVDRLNSNQHTWDPLDTGSASLASIADAPHSQTINVYVVAFGIYRISGIPKPGDGVTELIAYPSPLRAGSENATIDYLMGDNADCDVVIYDALGSLVRHFKFSAGSNGGRLVNEISWDGRNGVGDVVGNGAYIIQVTSTGHRARTKIGVAR